MLTVPCLEGTASKLPEWAIEAGSRMECNHTSSGENPELVCACTAVTGVIAARIISKQCSQGFPLPSLSQCFMSGFLLIGQSSETAQHPPHDAMQASADLSIRYYGNKVHYL
jgi:hypothetical protein